MQPCVSHQGDLRSSQLHAAPRPPLQASEHADRNGHGEHRDVADITNIAQGSSGAGGLLRYWRHRRRMSQLGLASSAQVSTRHLSDVELTIETFYGVG